MYILLNDILQATTASYKNAKEIPKAQTVQENSRMTIWYL